MSGGNKGGFEFVEPTKKFIKENYAYILLVFIFLFAFFIRSNALGGDYLNADDPYRALRASEYFIENYSLPTNDSLSYYPNGANFYGDGLVWYYTAGIISVIFSIIGVSDPALLASQFYPPLFGALAVVLAFFLGKEIFNSKETGLFSSILMASIPAILFRTNSAFADKEPIAVFWMMFALLFIVKSFKKFNVRDSLLGGLGLLFMGMTWGGIGLISAVLGIMGTIMVLINKFDENFSKTFLTSVGSYYIVGTVIHLLGSNAVPGLRTPQYLLPLAVMSALGINMLNKKYKFLKGDWNKYRGTWMVLGAGIILLISSFIYAPLGEIVFGYLGRLASPLTGGAVGSTVAENRPASIGEFQSQLGNSISSQFLGMPGLSSLIVIFGAFYISLIGLGFLSWDSWKKKLDYVPVLFLIIFYIVILLLGKSAVRLLFLAGFPVALMAGYGTYKIGKLFWISHEKDSLRNVSRISGIFLVFVILSTNMVAGYVFGENMNASLSDRWPEALNWIEDNSEPSDVVLSWWDYGYIIQYYANRPTYVDPGHGFGDVRDPEVAKVFTSTNETEHLDFLESIDVKYIVHDQSMVGKYSAVSRIASDGEYTDSFQIFNFQDTVCVEEGEGDTCNRQVRRYGPLWLVSNSGGSGYPVLVAGNQPANVSKVCNQDGAYVVDEDGVPGCAMFSQNQAVYMGLRSDSQGTRPVDLSDTMFAQMWFFDAKNLDHFEKVHDNGLVKVFEVKY